MNIMHPSDSQSDSSANSSAILPTRWYDEEILRKLSRKILAVTTPGKHYSNSLGERPYLKEQKFILTAFAQYTLK